MAQDWKSWKLKRATLICTVCIEVALVAGIIITMVLSHKKHGFVAVSNDPIRTIGGALINSRLQWSAIPAIVMSIFGLLYDAIVSAAAQRQPFVELVLNSRRPNPRDARVTIALDYGSYPIFRSWLDALRNYHFHLASALFFQLVASIFLVALASNLFSAQIAQFPTDIELTPTSAFNLSRLYDNTPLLPALDLTSAIWVYDAKPPVWMTEYVSLEEFVLPQPSAGNVTVAVAAFGVKPQCQQMAASEVNLTYVPNSAAGTLAITFMDRGCEIEPNSWPILSTRQFYSYTWYQSCSPSDKSEDRIGIFAAAYDAFSPSRTGNATVVSCFPTYWNYSVELNMSIEDGRARQILEITQVGEKQMTSDLFRTLHSNLALTRTQDSSGTFEADSFGRVVLVYAQKLTPTVQIDPVSITNATETVYNTFFAAFVRNELMSVPEEPSDLHASLQKSAMRLFTVDPIAYALEALICMILLCTIGIFVHVELTTSCLQEEPQGLLRFAMLLCKSDVMTFVESFRSSNPEDKHPGKTVEKHWSMAEAKCWYEESSDSAGRIRLEGLKRLSPVTTKWQTVKARFRMLTKRRKSTRDIDLSEQEPLRSTTKNVSVSQQQVK